MYLDPKLVTMLREIPEAALTACVVNGATVIKPVGALAAHVADVLEELIQILTNDLNLPDTVRRYTSSGEESKEGEFVSISDYSAIRSRAQGMQNQIDYLNNLTGVLASMIPTRTGIITVGDQSFYTLPDHVAIPTHPDEEHIKRLDDYLSGDSDSDVPFSPAELYEAIVCTAEDVTTLSIKGAH